MNYDREPAFKRSQWGAQRYYNNPRNPMGRALIIITLLFTGTMMLLIANRAGPFAPEPTPRWSPSTTPAPGPLLPPLSTPGP